MVLSGEDAFEKDLSKSPTLGRGKQDSKMDMMMMMWLHSSTGLLLEMGSAKCVGDTIFILISPALKYTSLVAMGKWWPVAL